jgi:hypothetical protein
VTGTPNVSTSAVSLSPPGSYSISWAVPIGVSAPNYTIQTVDGTLAVTVNGAPSVVAITTPLNPTAVNSPVTVTATFSDPDVPESTPYAASINWGDGVTANASVLSDPAGATPGQISGSHNYAAAGVYVISVTVWDKIPPVGTHSGSLTAQYYVVVYDPSAGFVTGGGWINSLAGAYTPNPALTGKANFGFVAKYQKGKSVPDGSTEFQFKAGDLNFKSGSYDWLVITNSKGQYKGIGTINGTGNYGFMLTMIDGDISGGGGVDKFRMKIWDKNNGDAVVYDNQLAASDLVDPSTALGGGSIVIHSDQKTASK